MKNHPATPESRSPAADPGSPRHAPPDHDKPRIIAVGMSGGVDSTMAALLLKQAGYQVIGLTMSIWDGSVPLTASGASGCFGPGEAQDIEKAQQNARRIGIPHEVITLAGEYRRNVLDYFCAEYRCGRTPNPCVVCNQRMKFGLLPDRARAQGIRFDRFATGHYVRIRHDPDTGLRHLYRGIDRTKDQSYFLARLTQQQLAGLMFPLGEYRKQEIVTLARDHGFQDTADEPESQDFIESDDYSPLFNAEDSGPGPIIDLEGKVLGEHRGIIHYTIGQRGGLGISAGTRLYVKELRAQTNTVVLAPRDALYSHGMRIDRAHWIAARPENDFECNIQLRYRHRSIPARLQWIEHDRWQVAFQEPQFAVTPGQTAVCYHDDECLGGAWIEKALD